MITDRRRKRSGPPSAGVPAPLSSSLASAASLRVPPSTASSVVPSASPRSTAHPRLLFVGTYLAPPASRAISEDVAARLARAGWETRLTSRLSSRYARPVDILGTILRRRRDYDVAHVDVFSGAAFRWAEWACRALDHLGKPYVLTLHGGNLPEFSRRHPDRVRRLLARATAVTSPSEYLRVALAHLRSDVRTIPNSLDVGAYGFRPRVAGVAPRLLWLRSFHEIYDPTLAVRVVARLAPAVPSLRLTMVGKDKDGSMARVEREVERLGVADRVTIVPGVPKSQVPTALQGGDIFVNTARVDNAPVSVIEAMATGMCVVSTNVGGIPYLLRHERDALLVPAGDEAALAAAVERLLDQPELAARLSAGARATAECFAWEHVLPAWELLFGDVAARCGWSPDA